MNDYPPFPGFRPEAFTFFTELAENNNREWFKPRKQIYDDEIVWPFRCLIADSARRAPTRHLPLLGDPERSLFRIYRDTRFSKDKLPYKTHAGGVLSRTGDKNDAGAVYIHIEPGNSMIASGFWMPDPSLLRAWRNRMVERSEEWLDVLEQLQSAGMKPETENALKRLPKGYEHVTDTRITPYLLFKSFYVVRKFEDARLQQPEFTESVLDMMVDALPILQFGWSVEESLVQKF